MARLIRAAPYFLVPDVDAAVAYYQEVLGFVTDYAAGSPPVFAICSCDGNAIMFRVTSEPARIHPMERQGGTWDVFFWVDDVDAHFGDLSARGVDIVYEPTVQPYGMKEFAVRDPNGYVLGFGQEWHP